jgi:hypothetical protein
LHDADLSLTPASAATIDRVWLFKADEADGSDIERWAAAMVAQGVQLAPPGLALSRQ